MVSVGATLVSGCQLQRPGPLQQVDIATGGTLARDGLGMGGDLVVAIDAIPGGCRAAKVWRSVGDDWRETARGPAISGDPCPRVTAQLAGGGRTIAIYDYSAGRAEILDLVEAEVVATGSAVVDGAPGARFPPPGPNIALSADGLELLLGSVSRGCQVIADGSRVCGEALLFEHRYEDWVRVASIVPEPALAEQVRFGEAVALDATGGVALIGGTGQPGRSGALGLYALTAGKPRLVQTLQPPKPLFGFATDLSLSGDGRWLAVGGAHV